MLKTYLNTKYFLQMYLNNNYIDIFKYFCKYFLYYFQNIVLIHLFHYKFEMNEILDIKLVQLYNISIIYSRYPVA